jgi:Methylamine utilisation protein MauE
MRVSSVDLVGAAAQFLLAGTFLFASLSKVLTVGTLRETVERLGVRSSVAAPVAVGVLAAELLAGIGLLLRPGDPGPRILAVVLVAAFAGAGIRALVRGERIPCACFGGDRGEALGWTQIRRLGLWLPLLAVAQWRPPPWTAQEGLLLLAVLLLGLAWLRLPAPVRRWRRLRGDRLAIAEGLQAQRVGPVHEELVP